MDKKAGKDGREEKPPLEDRIFDQTLMFEFSCSICLHLIHEPTQCPLGHSICYPCFQELIKYHQLTLECPTCRAPMDREVPIRNLELEASLAKLEVYCKFHFKRDSEFNQFVEDDDGCFVHLTRAEIEEHEKICPRAPVSCKYSERCGIFRRDSLESHHLNCIYQPVSCKYCDFKTLLGNLEAHLNECPLKPIPCSHCQEHIVREKLPLHIKKHCRKVLRTCPYASQGCSDDLMDFDALQQHLLANTALHVELLHDSFTQSLQNMENKFSKMLAEKDAEIEELRRNRHRYRFCWDVDWKREWASSSFQVKAITSRHFQIMGHQFYLALWPIGEPEEGDVSSVQNPSPNQSYHSPRSASRDDLPMNASRPRSFSRNARASSSRDAYDGGRSPESLDSGGFLAQVFGPSSPATLNCFGRRNSKTESSKNGPYVSLFLMMENPSNIQQQQQNASQPIMFGSPPSTPKSTLSGISGFVGGFLQGTNQQQEQIPLVRRSSISALSTSPQMSSTQNQTSLPSSLMLEYTLRIINNSPLMNRGSYFETVFPLPEGNGWGDPQIMETSGISRASGFLSKNDILHIQCDIQVRQCTFDI